MDNRVKKFNFQRTTQFHIQQVFAILLFNLSTFRSSIFLLKCFLLGFSTVMPSVYKKKYKKMGIRNVQYHFSCFDFFGSF